MAGDITGLGPRTLGNSNALDNTNRANSERRGSGEATSTTNTNAAAASGNPVGDALTLSTGAEQMRNLSDNLSEQTPFDQGKVDRIKALIDQGEYQIDSAKIAEKLRAFEQV